MQFRVEPQLLIAVKMRRIAILSVIFVLCYSASEEEACPRKHHALIIAFVPLHGGDDCQELMQRGIQQTVALEEGLKSVNTETDLQLGLKVFDTCSRKEKALEAALKGMLFAEKRCSKYPIFLGFLGPGDEESIKAISYARAVFNYTHVVPSAVRSFQLYNTINVEMIDAADRAKGITSFLKYLNWSSFILVFTSDAVSSRIVTWMMESGEFCLTNSILELPSFASGTKDRHSLHKLRKAVEDVQEVRIVIITDDEETVSQVAEYVEDEWGDFQFVIYVQNSGLLPWRLPKEIFQKSVILHQVPKSPIPLSNFYESLKNSSFWASYTAQIGVSACGAGDRECQHPKVVIDASLLPYIHSINLLSKALKATTRKKCKTETGFGLTLLCDELRSMKQDEWHDLLQDTTATLWDADTSTDQIIRFYSDLKNAIDVIVYNEEELHETVGRIENEVKVSKPESLKKSKRSRMKQCLVDMYEYEIEPDVEVREPPGIVTVPNEEEIPFVQNFGYYELMATVIGFSIGIIMVITLAVFCVYRSFRPGPRPKSTTTGECDVEDFR